MLRFARAFTSAAVLWVAVSAYAQGDGYVGVYADPQGTTPCTNVPQGTGTTLYVIANLAGASANGITGAEFRIEVSSPSGWFLSYAEPTGTTVLGNIFDTEPGNPNDGSGLNISFSTCQYDTSGKVSLGTIGVFNATGSPTSLSVKRHSTPWNTDYDCPLLVFCDDPDFTKACMSSGSVPECNLMRRESQISSADPAVFTAGLNTEEPPGGGVSGELHPMAPDLLVRAPQLAYNPTEPDVVGLYGEGKPALRKTLSDTTWIGSYSFDGSGGACNATGWTSADNFVQNDGNSHWIFSTENSGSNGISNYAAVLRSAGCWDNPGYGNNWDQSIKLKYKGSDATLSFRFLSDSQPSLDFVTIEADSLGLSDALVDSSYAGRWPHHWRRELLLYQGEQLTAQVSNLQLPYFDLPNAEHVVYIRFSSSPTGSAEDNGYPTQIGAGLVVDNIAVTGASGYNYTEDFDPPSAIDSHVALVNSSRSRSLGTWARLYSHVTDNDRCVENTTCSWLFTDPLRLSTFADMSFGPGSAVTHQWFDNAIISPWITLNTQDPTTGAVLSFREFPGNRFSLGRIARGWSIRGSNSDGTCVTQWSGDDDAAAGSWQALDDFTWATRSYDISPFFDRSWNKVQVRIRVADWQGLYDVNPPLTFNPGPGPYVDRIRIGRVSTGPVIAIGPDTRFQAQDAFPTEPNEISPGEHFSPATSDSTRYHGACAFSMGYDIGGASSPNIVTGDSIVVSVVDHGSGITRVAFFYRVVAGPHVGREVPLTLGIGPQQTGSNGLCYTDSVWTEPWFGTRRFAIDFDDAYFRGGDVVQYFWYAVNGVPAGISYPPGITQVPDGLTIAQAEAMTGGLLEVNFLPTINWVQSYLSSIAASETGNVTPTEAQRDSSSLKNCILYVNKVNTARRSGAANRSSFMFTLDRLGYAGYYDVYDVQGFGNTNNDLGSRANVAQASGYALIVHDTGRSAAATIPNGTDPTTMKVDQAGWYRAYLAQGYYGVAGQAGLWAIGENWAFENQTNPLVSTDMGLATISNDQGMAVNPDISGVGSATTWDGCSMTFAGDLFSLAGGCPTTRNYDGATATGSAAVTHRYKVGTTVGSGAIVMSKSASYHWNTVGMGFNWFDIRNATGTPSNPHPSVTLARKILNCILPTNCRRSAGASDVQPEDQTDGLPRVTALYQNAPNPFNPTTTIKFDLARETHVTLRVYDISGRLVRTLVDGRLPQQRHLVTWNGMNDHGSRIASGVYLYKLVTSDYSSTRKLVVLK